jgi:photosystem II stability/assembly factor-like uncharacterized protein
VAEEISFRVSKCPPPSLSRTGVSYIDEKTAWIGLCRTTDGGRTWEGRTPVNEVARVSLAGLPLDTQRTKFVSAQRGWLLSDAMWYTQDGGLHFNRVGNLHPRGLPVFYKGRTGWIALGDVDGTHHFRTTDGGNTWKECPTVDRRKWASLSVHFLDAENAWAALIEWYAEGDDYRVARTQDGGCTWNTLWTPSNIKWWLGDIQFLTETDGWLMNSDHGPLLATTDGGRSWQPMPMPREHFDIYSIYFESLRRGFVSGSDPYMPSNSPGVFLTQDGGKTWSEISQSEFVLGSYWFPGKSVIPSAWGYGKVWQMTHSFALAQAGK